MKQEVHLTQRRKAAKVRKEKIEKKPEEVFYLNSYKMSKQCNRIRGKSQAKSPCYLALLLQLKTATYLIISWHGRIFPCWNLGRIFRVGLLISKFSYRTFPTTTLVLRWLC